MTGLRTRRRVLRKSLVRNSEKRTRRCGRREPGRAKSLLRRNNRIKQRCVLGEGRREWEQTKKREEEEVVPRDPVSKRGGLHTDVALAKEKIRHL